MASSDNFVSMEPSWMFRPAFPDSWISDAFARDTETITRALQNSLSNLSDNPSSEMFHQPGTPTTVSGGSENETAVSKRRNGGGGVGVNGGKVTKRKSRASKRATTTFITADPANFRQMVQQVTGVRFGGSVEIPVPTAVLKPEPQRPAANRIPTGCLPTLDTSAFFLNQASSGFASQQQQGPAALPHGSEGFEFGSFGSFPTLESWN